MALLIRIAHHNPEVLKSLFERAMNIACVCARSGNLPSDDDRERPQETGNYWFKEGMVVHLNGRTNNHWAYIKSDFPQAVVFVLDRRLDVKGDWANSVAAAIRASLGEHCDLSND